MARRCGGAEPEMQIELPKRVLLKAFRMAALLAMWSLAGSCFGQAAPNEPKVTSLCLLQERATEGSREAVRVAGLFSAGLELGTLDDDACSKEATWVELALRSEQNKAKLRKLLDRSHRAYVVFEGEFYGPPPPDPKLPEVIRKNYHPGWGHLGAFRTKLVVYAIREVRAAPNER
jgi:hypothetical protein